MVAHWGITYQSCRACNFVRRTQVLAYLFHILCSQCHEIKDQGVERIVAGSLLNHNARLSVGITPLPEDVGQRTSLSLLAISATLEREKVLQAETSASASLPMREKQLLGFDQACQRRSEVSPSAPFNIR